MIHSSIRRILCAALLVALPLGSGCAYVLGGSTKEIRVQSVPPGAVLTTQPATRSVTTPAVLMLERKHSYLLTAKRDGYLAAQVAIDRKMRVGPLIFDILFVFPCIVDAYTGAWWDLQPDRPILTLPKLDASTPGPGVIHVRLSTDRAQEGWMAVSADEPVEIEVRVR